MQKNKEYTAKDFIPLWDNLIVRPIKVTEKNGFVRPQNEEDKAELGEVVAVGNHVLDDIKTGMIVYFNKYSSTKIDTLDEVVVRAEDVVAIIKKK
jgi:co-chaperonin GroES (HSP10)